MIPYAALLEAGKYYLARQGRSSDIPPIEFWKRRSMRWACAMFGSSRFRKRSSALHSIAGVPTDWFRAPDQAASLPTSLSEASCMSHDTPP